MENPSAAKPPIEPGHPGDPCVMVIFGAGGDLAKRKLFPALYNLAQDQLLPMDFAIVGFDRSLGSTDEFRNRVREDLQQFSTSKVEPKLSEWLIERFHAQIGTFQDSSAFQQMQTFLARLDKEHGTKGNYLYYLSTAPDFFAEIIRQLGAAGLTGEKNGQWRRVIIEKPFGRDLKTAQALNQEITQTLTESQIYRIDHYLGKETVQNILALRFGNGIFEPVWNRRYIDHVQITVAETVGVETRGGYYDQAGALRDMVPNHIFQLISLTAMEPPGSFEADAIRNEQTKLLRAIRPLSEQDVHAQAVRGQYGEGALGKERLPAYRVEPRVSTESTTETFVALKLQIENWRWADVPFYLRTGKRLPKRASEIVIQFKRVPFMFFRKTAVERLEPNQLVLRIQPKEGIALRFGAKVPGPIVKLGPVEMDFCYEDYFCCQLSTGYERLLYECMIGDATLFQRTDMVEASWGAVQPILDVWEAEVPRNLSHYAAGSWGPAAADQLMEHDGHHWLNPDSTQGAVKVASR